MRESVLAQTTGIWGNPQTILRDSIRHKDRDLGEVSLGHYLEMEVKWTTEYM